MSQFLSVAARLSSSTCQAIGIQVLARSQPIGHLAESHQVSRKFIYQQGDKAQRSLDESFAPSQDDGGLIWPASVTLNRHFLNRPDYATT